ncbi:ribonuclease H-like protein [Phlegmacium glaucopus]|nr:ribonuclease H-like protein [Phlegmacium glaucopus]
MALGLEDKFNDEQRLPGRYLALDCEMVGVGINASESSLARQRERVVDYRTRWSGIRASDMIDAKPFEEVQKAVNDLLDGRILIGHAVYNDLKALLLSHPTRQTRDTQSYAYKFALSKSHHISLKNLAKQELGIGIQTGEHSSVVDARVTMAIYRLHKKDWEGASRTFSQILEADIAKLKYSQLTGIDDLRPLDGDSSIFEKYLGKAGVEPPPTSKLHKKKGAKKNKAFPGGGRKGVSSGLSTVVRRGERRAATAGEEPPKSKYPWWKILPSGSAKGYVRLDR